MGYRKALAVALTAVLALGIVGCGNEQSKTPASPPATPTPAPNDESTIKVGAIWSLTGEFSMAGQPGDKAARLAIKEINDSGGVLGKKIEMVTVDGKGNQTETINAMSRLVNNEKVVAVFGLEGGVYVTACAPVAQAAKVPYLVSIGTSASLTDPGDYVFMTAMADDFQGDMLAKFCVERLKAKTACVMTDIADPYSTGISEFFIKGFKKYSNDPKSIISQESYHSGDVDFAAQLTRVKNLKQAPDVLAILANPAEAPLIAKQARDLGVKAQFIGGDGVDSVDLVGLGGKAVEGMVYSTHFFPGHVTNPVAEKFLKDYQAEYKSEAGAWEALGYDAALLIANAIKVAGKAEPEAVRQALSNTKEFQGVTGQYAFDERRIPMKGVVFVEIVNGQRQFLEEMAP